jgi:hypothetical protein
MSFPSELTTSELSAVNQILAAVGQAPVTTLDQTNPDTTIAYNTLVEVSREIQAQGWIFNSEFELPLIPDNDGDIIIPSNVLRVDRSEIPENFGLAVVARSGKLYNAITHTFNWSALSSPLKCDVVYLTPFDDCPQPFKDYVTARASVVASSRMVGDPNQFRLLKEREEQSRAMWMQHESEQGNYTMFGFPRGQEYYYSYKPFLALRR